MKLAKRISSLALSATVVILKSVAVRGKGQFFFAEDRDSCSFTSHVNADGARDDFVSSLGRAAASYLDFESIPEGTAPPFDANLGDVTARFIGDSGVRLLSVENHICAVSGQKALVRDSQEMWGDSPAFRIEFSKPIFAFGFYGMSFGSQLWIEAYDSEGQYDKYEVPLTGEGTGEGNNGLVFFYGIIDQEHPFKSVGFKNKAWADGWAIDDITNAHSVPEPSPNSPPSETAESTTSSIEGQDQDSLNIGLIVGIVAAVAVVALVVLVSYHRRNRTITTEKGTKATGHPSAPPANPAYNAN